MKTHAKEDKWLLISCLQKSIRKGFEALALSYADKLYDLDSQYLLYQLSIIALEDIGLANLPLVRKTLLLQNDIDILEQFGGHNFILELVRDFTLSNKDRSIADLSRLAKITKPLNVSDIQSLENLFIDESKSLITRLLAGYEIFGCNKFKNPLLTNEAQDLEDFLELHDRVIKDKSILDILRNAYLIYREPCYIALGLLSNRFLYECHEQVGKYKTGSVVEQSHSSIIVDNKWLIDGIDWHTKEGKLAIENFIADNPLTIELLKKAGVSKLEMPNVIGLLMFRSNGHCVNKRIVYPSAVLISKITQIKELEQIIKNNSVAGSDIIKTFRQDYPMLLKKIEDTFKVPDPSLFPF